MSSGDEGRIELCHFGTVYGNRNPLPLLKAISELFEEGKIRHASFRLRLIGEWAVNDHVCESLAQALEEKGLLKREAPISHEACLQEMAKSTVLLALQPNYPLQIPAKIYEYVASGRPLLVIGRDGATSHLVERYGLGSCCENEVGLLKKLIGQFTSGEIQISQPSPETVARFHYRTLSAELAEVFNDVSLEKAERYPQ